MEKIDIALPEVCALRVPLSLSIFWLSLQSTFHFIYLHTKTRRVQLLNVALYHYLHGIDCSKKKIIKTLINRLKTM